MEVDKRADLPWDENTQELSVLGTPTRTVAKAERFAHLTDAANHHDSQSHREPPPERVDSRTS